MTHNGESGEVNVSDREYKVGHNKQNRPEITIGGGGIKNVFSNCCLSILVHNICELTNLTLGMLGNFFKYFLSFKRCKKSMFPPKYFADI